MKINERLKALRKDNGLTQTELAKILGIGQTTIAAYESGLHEPQIFSLIAYADYFECSVDYLVGKENEFSLTQTLYPGLTKDEKTLLDAYRSCENEQLKQLILQQALLIKNSPLNRH